MRVAGRQVGGKQKGSERPVSSSPKTPTGKCKTHDFPKTHRESIQEFLSVFTRPLKPTSSPAPSHADEIMYECDHIQRNYLKTNQPHCLNSLRKLLKLNHFFFVFHRFRVVSSQNYEQFCATKGKKYVLFYLIITPRLISEIPSSSLTIIIIIKYLLLIILLLFRQQNGDHDSNRIDWLFQHW